MAMATLEYQRNYYRKHKGYWQDYYQRNREKIRAKSRSQYKQNPEAYRERMRQSCQEVKLVVLTHYGNGRCACVKCGESRLACLSIDHIDGGGNKHKQQLRRVAHSFYRWLKWNNYPNGYQTLCMNCQWVKRVEQGECTRKD